MNGSTSDVITNTNVSFATASASVSEGSGTYNVTVNLTNPSGSQPTGVDVVLLSGNGARINGFTSQTISFPTGSNTPIDVTLTITDDALCNGDEVLTLALQNLTGGESPSAGANRTLTITDNESTSNPVAVAASPVNHYDFTANWNAITGATGYFLDVSLYSDFLLPGTTNVVTWNFPSGSADITADGGIAANLGKTISTTATGATSFVAGSLGAPDQSISNNNWVSGDGTKWWEVEFVTTGYASLTVSSKQQSSGTGPRDFKIQYKIGAGGTWTDVPSGAITVANNFTTGVVTNLALPTACDNQASVYLRWIMTSNISVNNGALGATGTDRIDDIVVNGRAPSYVSGYNNLPVAGTSQSVTDLTSLTTYYYRVRSTGGCSTGNNSNTITVSTVAVPTYYSRATGNVTDPIWSDTPAGVAGPATFTSASNMVVQSGHVVTNTGTTDVKDLTIDAGGTLELSGGSTLTVNGSSASIVGTLTAIANSTFELDGAPSATLAVTGLVSFYNFTVALATGATVTGDVDIRGTLQLNDGVFDASGANVTLRSTAFTTGRLGPVAASASYTGDLKVERYIPEGATNWRLLGSPVGGKNVAAWQDDFITAGYPGSQYPDFDNPVGSGILWPSIRHYDETNAGPLLNDGVIGVSSSAQALSSGKGFAAWSGDQLGGTAPFVIDLNGPPNLALTPITLPMTYTNTGVPGTDGWNLVSNPVPSPILFSAIDRGADVGDFITYYNPANGNTAVYDISLDFGTNDATDMIQSSQGFFLKANGTDVTTTVEESDKTVGNDGGMFGGDEENATAALRLKITSAINTYNDETAVVFSTGTPEVDGADALKYVFAVPDAPQIATMSGSGELIAINAYGTYSTAISIPVMVNAGVSGNYTVTATGPATLGLTCLSLEDLLTGEITPLSEGATYSFEMDADADASVPRLLLHATVPLSFDVQDATCGGMANGQATVVITEGPADVTWTDEFGAVLSQQTGVMEGDVTFGGLAAGSYMVHVTSNTACGVLTNEFTIDAPFVLEGATVSNNATTCADTEDGSIDVMIMGGVEPYTYAWSNGADTEDLVAGAGEYTFTVTDANDCEWVSDVFSIDAGGAIAGFTVVDPVVLVNTEVIFTNTSVSGETFFWEFGDGATSTELEPVHAYSTPGIFTVTLTVTSGDCSDVTSFDVTVELNTGISTSAAVGVSAWVSSNGFVVEHGFTSGTVYIEVLDATGRLHATRNVGASPGRVILSHEGLTTGIWFVRVTNGDKQQTFRLPLLR